MATTSGHANGAASATRAPSWAWLPIPVFVAIFLATDWIAPQSSFEPRLLLPLLNIALITGVCLLVAVLAERSYRAGEPFAVLLLGCGTLVFGAGSLIIGAGVLLAPATNTVITAANLTAVVAGACFMASALAVFAAGRMDAYVILPRSRAAAVLCYGGAITVIGALTAASLDGLLPPFFEVGSGPTAARQVMLGAATLMFAASAVLFRVQRRLPPQFSHWYSLALLLIALSLVGFFEQHVVGSVLGWSARVAQYTGCLYMFVAVQSLPRSRRARRLVLDRTLRETERRHRSLVDLCPDAILVHTDGTYVFANPAAARLFGAQSPDQVVGRAVLDLVHPESRPLAARRMERAQRGEITALQEMRFLRLDGSAIDVEATGARVQFRGRPAVQAVVRDVSERRRDEEALRLQSSMATELLRVTDTHAIFDLLADRIFAVAGDVVVAVSEFHPRERRLTVRSVRCTETDRAHARAAFGRDPEGLSLQFPEEARQRWTPGQLAPVPGGLADILFGQVPVAVCERLVHDLRLGDMFGMACAYEEDILGTVAILTRGRGALPQQELIESLVASAALALKRGRTDDQRKQLEQELRASEGLLRSVTDHTTDAVYVKDRDSRWLMANPALLRIVARSADDVLGLTDAEIYADPAIGEAIVANDRTVLTSGEPMVFEEAAETPEGVRWFLSTKAPMRNAAGTIVGLIGISRDITERKRMEEALREADRRKTEFIAMLSHELRNPLAPIRYALPLIRKGAAGPQAEAAVGVVSRQVDHLVRLVDDLLDVSRITRGQIDLRRELVTLDAVVTRAVESTAPLVDEARHRLTVRLAGQAPWIDADPHRVTQIITNLLTNAAKYTPPGGEITLEAGREGDEAIVRVTDNGIGIPPDVLPTLFEMFYQAHAPDRAQGGLGIGLALARRLVEMHGGTIEAHSGGVGLGAEFVVRLPIAHDVALRTIEPTAGSPAAPGRRLKVLIVDDNHDLVEMLAIVVSTLGHEVHKAMDGPSALFVARTQHPDVVLLDLGLPGLGGLEVARELRAHPETARALLVAFTGLGQADDYQRTREAGFDYHLTKPTDPETLERLLVDVSLQPVVER